MKQPTFLFRIRTFADSLRCEIWLIRRDGPADSCMLYGGLSLDVAEEMVSCLGLPVERETRAYAMPTLVRDVLGDVSPSREG